MSRNHKLKEKKAKNVHDLEHKQWSRRSFIQALGIGGSGSLLMGGNMLRASAVSPLAVALNQANSDRILVLIRLQGGNDGLNTIVPMDQYDAYANYRPSIYHRQDQLISLNDDFAMPQYMQPLESMWGDGQMKVVNGVGYQEQSLSHFTSSDIWASSGLEEIYSEGFLGRHFTESYPDYLLTPPTEPLAIQIGSIGNLIFEDDDITYSFLVSNPDQLQEIAESGVQFSLDGIDANCQAGSQKEFLRQQSNSTYAYSGVIHDAYTSASNSVSYEDNKIAQQLAIVSRLIKGNLGTKVFMVTLNGFDTHVGQAEKHQELMGDLSLAVKNFFDDLKNTGHDENVLGMTFSEFGRRATENGSNGTDHGAASTTLFFGPGLKDNGFVGEYPDITDLDKNGNLKFNTDFRGLYATILSQWLCLDIGAVTNALGGEHASFELGFNCEETTDPEDPSDPTDPIDPVDPTDPTDLEDPKTVSSFSHKPFYDVENGACIHFEAHKAMHIDIQLYNMVGKNIGTLFNEFVTEGPREFIVKDRISFDMMARGQYIYRVTNFEGSSSKIILIE